MRRFCYGCCWLRWVGILLMIIGLLILIASIPFWLWAALMGLIIALIGFVLWRANI